jgi:hypothetical protein
MTFSKFPAAVLLAILAGCASNAPKKDAYAEAAATKRAEIDRLSRRIDSLRVLPTTETVDRQLDSLRTRRSLEVGNLQGIGQAAEIQGAMPDTSRKILDFTPDVQRQLDEPKTHPIK